MIEETGTEGPSNGTDQPQAMPWYIHSLRRIYQPQCMSQIKGNLYARAVAESQEMSEMDQRRETDTCAVGLPLPATGPCTYCGATANGPCRMLNEFSPREIRENRRKAEAGEPIEL